MFSFKKFPTSNFNFKTVSKETNPQYHRGTPKVKRDKRPLFQHNIPDVVIKQLKRKVYFEGMTYDVDSFLTLKCISKSLYKLSKEQQLTVIESRFKHLETIDHNNQTALFFEYHTIVISYKGNFRQTIDILIDNQTVSTIEYESKHTLGESELD